MGLMKIAIVFFAPVLAIMVTMGVAYLDEQHGTGKDLTRSNVALGVIALLTLALTYLYVTKTPLGAPIFELLHDGGGGGSLVIFSGSLGIPLPLALLSILMLLLFCVVTAACSAVSLVMLAYIVAGLALKVVGKKQ